MEISTSSDLYVNIYIHTHMCECVLYLTISAWIFFSITVLYLCIEPCSVCGLTVILLDIITPQEHTCQFYILLLWGICCVCVCVCVCCWVIIFLFQQHSRLSLCQVIEQFETTLRSVTFSLLSIIVWKVPSSVANWRMYGHVGMYSGIWGK